MVSSNSWPKSTLEPGGWFQLGAFFNFQNFKSFLYGFQQYFFGISVAVVACMTRLLIFAYIVFVLVLSAKAGASADQKSSFLGLGFNYSSEAP